MKFTSDPASCPLCRISGQTTPVRGPDDRRYHLCGNCSVIFVEPPHHLPQAEERARYETHKNSIEDPGYVRHLNRLLHPMLPHLDRTMRGLDYGSGPVPVLSLLVRQQGIVCDDYDPFFADSPPRPPYDFVISSECFEHFCDPAGEIGRIRPLLKPGGLLGIMTERWVSVDRFGSWHYPRDPTHVVFYHADSFAFMCTRFGFATVWRDEIRVTILRRNEPGSTKGS
ncbi:class I SAM-dependent methyltransferase [Candidatus Fermentibacteria bacterium]|nr:class I SAM-dependent methyltransferase [Candidatus Fermentibacteria bacterium]